MTTSPSKLVGQNSYNNKYTSSSESYQNPKSPLPSLSPSIFERLFHSDIAKKYFLDASPNILICGPPRSGKTSIIDVLFYKASPHETLSYQSSGSRIHSINHTPLFRCTVIDLVSTNLTTNSPISFNFYSNNNDKNVLNLPYFSSHSSTSAYTSPESYHLTESYRSETYSSVQRNKGSFSNFKSDSNWSLENPLDPNELKRDNNGNTPYSERVLDELLFKRVASIIFIVDAQSDPLGYNLTQAKDIFKRAWKYNPNVKFEVFIHKVDGDIFSTDEVRSECQRSIHDKLMNFLDEEKVKNADVMFYSTSIYDHTIFEAFSRVMQNLAKNLSAYSQLLDTLVAKCKMERAFLMDSHTKAFIATDSSSFDPFNYELCSEMIDVMVELSSIYGPKIVNQGTLQHDLARDNNDHTILIEDESTKNQPTNLNNNGPPQSCLITLTSGHILYLKEIDNFLALACTIRGVNFDRQHLIDYNIKVFKEALSRLTNLST